MKKYDKEFKLQPVQMIQEDGESVAQVARELGLSDNTLYRWIAEYTGWQASLPRQRTIEAGRQSGT